MWSTIRRVDGGRFCELGLILVGFSIVVGRLMVTHCSDFSTKKNGNTQGCRLLTQNDLIILED